MSSTGAGSQPANTGREAFSSVYRKTSIVVGNLTVLVLLVRGARHFIAEARGHALAEALIRLAVELTIEVVLAVLFSLVVVALPIAGLVYYIQYITRET